jgi:hypothetical protein
MRVGVRRADVRRRNLDPGEAKLAPVGERYGARVDDGGNADDGR